MNVLESSRLDGKVALVTGAAGRYCRQLVEALAEAGAKTYMADLKIELLQERLDEFSLAGLDVAAIQLDQSEEESIKSAFVLSWNRLSP